MTTESEYLVLAQKAVEEELRPDVVPRTKRQIWEKMGKMLEDMEFPKDQISKKVKHTIEELLKQETGKEIKINSGHYYSVMAENGWQDPTYSGKAADTVENDITYKEPQSRVRFVKDVPEGKEWDLFDAMMDIARLEVVILERMKEKVILNKGAILNTRGKVDKEKQEMLERAIKIVNTRREKLVDVVKKNFKKFDHTLEDMKKMVAELSMAKQHLDDRMTITHWEKIMAMVMIDIGYDKNDIARFLKVNSKHIKLNVDSSEARGGLMGMLNIFKRCPNPDCGIILHEYFEGMLRAHREGNDEFYDNYDIEPLLITGYQKQVVRLKTENMKMKRRLESMSK